MSTVLERELKTVFSPLRTVLNDTDFLKKERKKRDNSDLSDTAFLFVVVVCAFSQSYKYI